MLEDADAVQRNHFSFSAALVSKLPVPLRPIYQLHLLALYLQLPFKTSSFTKHLKALKSDSIWLSLWKAKKTLLSSFQ